MLVGREVLVPEEEDKILDKGPAQLVCRRVAKRPREIDATHVGAERPCGRPHLNGLVGHVGHLRFDCSLATDRDPDAATLVLRKGSISCLPLTKATRLDN
jgi:hypothetical protein